jgi:hypothetical protein
VIKAVQHCSSDESSATHLLIDVGSCLIMLGGWMVRVPIDV